MTFPPWGSGFNVTYDDNISEDNYSGFSTEISTSNLEAKTNHVPGSVFDIVLRYNYANATGDEPTKAQLMALDYLYVGVGESNPSATSALFANDHFTSTGATSAEYDTLFVKKAQVVPEPSSSLFALGAIALCSGSRRRRQSP